MPASKRVHPCDDGAADVVPPPSKKQNTENTQSKKKNNENDVVRVRILGCTPESVNGLYEVVMDCAPWSEDDTPHGSKRGDYDRFLRLHKPGEDPLCGIFIRHGQWIGKWHGWNLHINLPTGLSAKTRLRAGVDPYSVWSHTEGYEYIAKRALASGDLKILLDAVSRGAADLAQYSIGCGGLGAMRIEIDR